MSEMTGVSVDSEDEVLARTRGVRLKIVSSLTKTENGFPADPDEAKLLIKALDGLDKQALTTKRMKVDEKIAAGAAASGKEIIAALLSKVSHAYQGSGPTIIIEAPVLSLDEVPQPELLPGETELGTKQLNFETFMQENGRLQA
jgi:hypothetical protein